ncbi:PRC-barrel domain-containing protein [uncultured Roseibium sp.]|uniref:PRC-barrel domain-containing protein n=1 Tax=uncultured Roseibium sp. TaxID=1936171 RepID=UPI00260D9825|nr:PRC-barrel domain-containing protein [uncultured Roseibium sp.]
MDHSSHEPLQAGEIIAANVKGTDIYGPDDKVMGNVSEMLGTGQYARAVIEVGGFFGIGVKQVALDMSRIDFMRDENGKVLAHTKMSKVELKNLPKHRG